MYEMPMYLVGGYRTEREEAAWHRWRKKLQEDPPRSGRQHFDLAYT
jgi:hypothetical protein